MNEFQMIEEIKVETKMFKFIDIISVFVIMGFLMFGFLLSNMVLSTLKIPFIIYNGLIGIGSLVRNFGNIFNGHTSIDNLIDTQVVIYNIAELSGKRSEIFDAQLFNALSICWANAVKTGSRMKRLYEEKQIAFADVRHFLLLIDESHKTINALKPYAVEQVLRYAREGRKFFAGIGLASQSIRDYVPDGVNSDAADKIKRLFELCQYKFILMQDSNSLKVIREIFTEQFTEAEIAMIPRLERGQCILAINGDKNVTLQVEVTDEELRMFKGGV